MGLYMVADLLQRLLSGGQLDRTCVAAVHTSSDQLVSGEYQEDVLIIDLLLNLSILQCTLQHKVSL